MDKLKWDLLHVRVAVIRIRKLTMFATVVGLDLMLVLSAERLMMVVDTVLLASPSFTYCIAIGSDYTVSCRLHFFVLQVV